MPIERRTSIDPGAYGSVISQILDYLATREEEAAAQPTKLEERVIAGAPTGEGPDIDIVTTAIARTVDDLQRRVKRLEDQLGGNVRPKERLRLPPLVKPRAKAAKKPPAKKAKRQ